MRVLAAVHGYPPHHCAGAETHLHRMLAEVVLAGHQVDVVLSRQQGTPYTIDGVDVHPTVNQRTDIFKHLPEADLLVTHLENAHRVMLLGAFNNVPVVHVAHNTFIPTKEVNYRPSVRCDLVVVNSEHMRNDFVDWCTETGRRPPPLLTVRPTVDITAYGTVRSDADRVTMLNLSKNGELLAAVAERMPNTRFLAVRGAYGPQADIDLPNVEVIDTVPHHEIVERVYQRTRVLLVPSRYESWGRVASEAMSSGIPVVVSPTDGLREQCATAATYCDPDDVDAWVRALSTLALPRPYAAASRRARDRAEELSSIGARDMAEWVTAAEQTAGSRAKVAA